MRGLFAAGVLAVLSLSSVPVAQQAPRAKIAHEPSARGRDGRAHRRLLRQQPGVQAGLRRRRGGRARVRHVRQRDAAAQRMGVGQKYLDGGVIAVEAKVGKGRAVLYGAEILQRAQPHGTFKLLFNAICASVAGSQ